MKKGECEKAIRHLCHEWRDGAGLSSEQLEHPSYLEFKLWAFEKGHSLYWNFHSTAGADYDAELWFDEELKQDWRR